MTPTTPEVTAAELVRAHDNSRALHVLIRAIPVGSVPTVIAHLVQRAYHADNPPQDWAPTDARAAHARYERGLRDPWTRAGERAYQRAKKRRYRLAYLAGRPQIAEASSAPPLTCDDASYPQDTHRVSAQENAPHPQPAQGPVDTGLVNVTNGVHDGAQDHDDERRTG